MLRTQSTRFFGEKRVFASHLHAKREVMAKMTTLIKGKKIGTEGDHGKQGLKQVNRVKTEKLIFGLGYIGQNPHKNLSRDLYESVKTRRKSLVCKELVLQMSIWERNKAKWYNLAFRYVWQANITSASRRISSNSARWGKFLLNNALRAAIIMSFKTVRENILDGLING